MTAFHLLRSLPFASLTASPLLLTTAMRRRRPSRVRPVPIIIALLALLGLLWWKHHKAPHTLTKWTASGQFSSVPAADRYDVLVVGGTPSGIAAALAAGRRGARVLMVEQRTHLGGDAVYAMLNQFDVPINPGNASPVHGIFAEFFDQLGVAFSVDHGRQLFESTVRADPNIEVMTETRVTRILKNGNRVVGADLQKVPVVGVQNDSNSTLSTSAVAAPVPNGGPTREVLANAVVDATNDADFAARAGSGYYVGRENANPDKRMQSAGLLFSVSGVNWKEVRLYVRGRRRMRASDVHKPAKAFPTFTPKPTPQATIQQTGFEYSKATRGNFKFVALPDLSKGWDDRRMPSSGKVDPNVWLHLGGLHGNYAWERGDIIKPYKPHGPDIMTLSINFGRQQDGSVVLNTVNILGVNGLDPKSRKHARDEALAELPYFIAYLRQKMPGFQNAQLKQAAPELYIRETRHVHGIYMLKASDVYGQTIFPDRVAMASYPLDLHPYTRNQINPFGPRRYYYTLPLRALVPKAVDGVFVASRSLSATYSAAGSCRVIPITMAAGEAAGVAAWLCATKTVTPHDLIGKDPTNLRTIQANLRDGGADIGDDIPLLIRGTTIKRAAKTSAKIP